MSKGGDRPAFPEFKDRTAGMGGMTLREYAAIQAMAGLAAGLTQNEREDRAAGYLASTDARAAVALADALIAELEKR